MIQTPTIAEVNTKILAQIETSISQSIPLLPKAFTRVLAKVLAGLYIILWKYAGFMLLQMFISTASAKDTIVNGVTINPLTEWGRLFGIGDPDAAVEAEYDFIFSVTNPTGTIATGTQVLGDRNGVTYTLTQDVAITGSFITLPCRATGDQSGGDGSGAQGNLISIPATRTFDRVTFISPIANVAQFTDQHVQQVAGADAEDVEVYRQRILDRAQKLPQGGAYADYEAWGESTGGIINTYPYTGYPGEVDVHSEATVASSGDPDGIPTAAQLIAVKASIEQNEAGIATRRPANAFINSYGITRRGFDIEVGGLVADNLVETKALIEASLDTFFEGREPFIPGVSILPRKDRISKSAVGGVVENSTAANNGVFVGVVVKLGGVAIDVYSLGKGEKSKVSSVVYT